MEQLEGKDAVKVWARNGRCYRWEQYCAGRPFKEHRQAWELAIDRSHAPRGNASTDALRSALEGTRSVPGCIPTQSVGTISVSVSLVDRDYPAPDSLLTPQA